MEVLFDGIPLGDVTTSMTISGPAVPVFCMYLVAAERQGVDLSRAQRHAADRHLQGVHRAEGVAVPARAAPAPHRRPDGVLRRATSRRTSRCRCRATTSARPGSTAAQELAFTLADGFGYVELGLSRGLDVDEFAPGLSFFFDAHLDFFEEIAKFRAARRIWARWLRDVYGAKTEKAQWLRFHTQTAGVSLTAQQPDNNIVRTAVEALAAVLGGTNSLHTNALDEVLALPSEKAAEIALRTQQVIMEETGVANVADPLGGSWYVEALTDRIEAEAEAIFARDPRHGLGRHDDRRGSCAASRTAGSCPRSPRRRSSTSRRWRRARRRSSASTATPRRSRSRWRSCGSPTRSSASRTRVLGRAPRRPRRRRRSTARSRRMVEAGRTGDGNMVPADARRGPRRGDARRDLRRAARRVGRLPRAAALLTPSLAAPARPAPALSASTRERLP